MTVQVNDNTNEKVQVLLNRLYNSKQRVRIWYGDPSTGTSWNEEYDVTGTISKSCGIKPCYLLINNSRSMGGGAILTDKIIRIDTIADRRTCYIHEKFNVDLVINDSDPYVVLNRIGTKEQARFKTAERAQRWLDFMNGKRYSK